MTTVIRKDDTRPKDVIPDVIADQSSGKRYLKGRFLGKVSPKMAVSMSSHDHETNQ